MTPLQALKLQLWAFRFSWRLERSGTILRLVQETAGTINSIVSAYLFARIIDTMIAVVDNRDTFESFVYIIIIAAVVRQVFSLLNVFIGWRHGYIIGKRNIVAAAEYRKKLAALGVQTLELPEINDINNRTNEELHRIWDSTDAVIKALQQIINISTSVFVVLSILPWAVPFLFILGIARFIPDRRLSKNIYAFDLQHTEYKRKFNMSGGILQRTSSLLEVQTSGLFDFFFGRWYEGRNFILEGYQKFRNVGARANAFLAIFDNILIVFIQLGLFAALLAQTITIGSITFAQNMISRFSSGIVSLLSVVNEMLETANRLTDVRNFFEMKPAIKSGDVIMEKLKVGPTIKFENVDFAYPGSDKVIIKNLDLEIKSGERIAIVGENGAGKTTLTKMLTRIYDPTSGTVTINGKDLKTLNLNSWYQNLGILEQEFNHYGNLSAKENIAIGDLTKPLDEELVRQAARMADADGFIQEYPQGYEQILSESFTGGIRPSTGQKQKLAIARFFYRNSPLIIFDEPTAAIDAVSEYNIFNQIYNFFEGKTVIIISHRFSTVRNADRILVMDHGEIVEQGNHEALMAMGGKYAEAFKLQAEGYKG